MAPIKVAVVGLGRRAWGVYFEILPKLKDFFTVTAVCDPLKEYADQAGGRLGVPAFISLRELVAAGCAEGAILVTPPESHHSGSIFLSRAGIHHVVETPMALTLRQCREMIDESGRAGAVLHVNEQFFREPLLAFAKQIIGAGVIGPVGRITWFHGHTGYHNNSIWQHLAGGKPLAVNAVNHAMPLRRHLDGAGRWQDREHFRLHVLHFANLLVTDLAGNIKSALGRCPRPGYLEIDGTLGTLVGQPYDDAPAPWEGRAEVRLVAEEDYHRGGYAQSYAIQRVTTVGHRVNISDRLPHGGEFYKLRCWLPDRLLEYENPLHRYGIVDGYLSAVGMSLLDFHRQVRQKAPPEFSNESAAGSAEIESAFARSAELGGARVELPFTEETAAERGLLRELRQQLGADPMDVDAMLDAVFPRNYELSAWEQERQPPGA
jgi:predicted dehydrogenase